jgi:hypothetical protein
MQRNDDVWCARLGHPDRETFREIRPLAPSVSLLRAVVVTLPGEAELKAAADAVPLMARTDAQISAWRQPQSTEAGDEAGPSDGASPPIRVLGRR